MKPIRKELNGTACFLYGSEASSNSIPLLIIHGHGGDHNGLDLLARTLGRRVVIPDLPGFGESKELKQPHTIENYVHVLEAIMKELDISQYDLAGHSLGSAIALALARQDKRVRRVVLLNPIPEFTKYIQYLIRTVNGVGSKIPQKYADALVNAKLYNLVTFLIHSRKRTDREYAKTYLTNQDSAQYSFKTWSESGESIFFFDQMNLASKIKQPVLVIHADKDTITTLKSITEFTATFTNAQLKRIPKAGHFLPIEEVDVTAKIINAYLESPLK